MIMPKERHNELMESFLIQLEARSDKDVPGSARVVLSGSLCQALPLDVLELIEETGVVVVDDDLYVGSRYIITDANATGDPIDALAEQYLKMGRHCPTKSSVENDWGSQLIEVVKSSRAQGVISILVKFCEPHYFYYPELIRILSEAGVPELRLEVEHDASGIGLAQIQTRVQAFVESLTGG
jgi:benzoyl-CoA reductase/2-hydroxyglutaryl-CoA dehydratase subunit BcrC/BadD/HgdB